MKSRNFELIVNNYWNQWNYNEIMSFHGVEPCFANEDEIDPSDYEEEQEEEDDRYTCRLSMENLGMSWRDFM